jgi:hypothetical protein
MTTEQYEAEMQKFGKALLIGVLGFVTACVVTGSLLTMLLH